MPTPTTVPSSLSSLSLPELSLIDYMTQRRAGEQKLLQQWQPMYSSHYLEYKKEVLAQQQKKLEEKRNLLDRYHLKYNEYMHFQAKLEKRRLARLQQRRERQRMAREKKKKEIEEKRKLTLATSTTAGTTPESHLDSTTSVSKGNNLFKKKSIRPRKSSLSKSSPKSSKSMKHLKRRRSSTTSSLKKATSSMSSLSSKTSTSSSSSSSLHSHKKRKSSHSSHSHGNKESKPSLPSTSSQPSSVSPSRSSTSALLPTIVISKPSLTKQQERQIAHRKAHQMKEYEKERFKVWRTLALTHVPKVARSIQTNHAIRMNNVRRLAKLMERESQNVRRPQEKKSLEQSKLKRLMMKEMLMFWKQNEKSEKEAAKKAHLEALEQQRLLNEQREQLRQDRKLHFLLSQTELFMHFVKKKAKQEKGKRRGRKSLKCKEVKKLKIEIKIKWGRR
ncbi:putative DNA helicase ino80 [Coelomomyces lativittatus]|nr:putative DNA helicase ino80 [Coelomomyces lativittatus]